MRLSIGANVSAGSVYVHSDDSIKVLNGVSIKVDGVSSGVLELEGNFAGNSTHNSSADASLQIGSGVSLSSRLGSISLQVSSGSALSIDSSSSVLAGMNISFGGNVNVDWWQHVCGFWRCHFPERFRGCFVCTLVVSVI